ncbi:TPA: fimbrial biogenesis outer membrane usher protein [Escherichia coli]|uniref:Fimbrial biogenesis outer membrane usher protein n=1 Tax=Escherichia coli TaxID=562 RepID=A0A8S7Y2V5_ECOLX|nr:fimbrial biogenesis outer membrane usher protein [Escherichia coli]EFE3926775.1 fimbrial biogenesis outer membrane usher protein [Escherichia coli]EFE7138416.1 fimbria/pilus outer membrane usher protein [Escherichia coli]EFJ4445018.1 fimbrial biogenesis outer membrane usher protein [Escherichia coli]EFM1446400.1 fimbrial biogenesis outer membrane usher protein [Escherichia coli]EHI0299051.1 fimbrial biogenesis outer membrane usher protein [Escherichia coli]
MLRTTRWVAAIIFLYSFPGYAEETFDTHFMIGGMRGEKVSEYRFDNKQPLPGNYELDFYVNHQWRGKKDITIPESPAKPCLPKVLLTTLGVKTDNLNTEDNCILLDEAVHGGQYQWDISEHRLNLTVPQAYINELERGYVPPESWDRGIDAFYTSYNLSQYRSYDSNNNSNTASYGRFNSGLNLFSWQLHSDASYSKPDDMKGKWQSNTLYLERGWSQILSTVQIGENYTSSLIFDSLRFSGIRLFRDMQMLPDSMQSFTPLVQGVAQSNALITVSQNGYTIYQKEVPPGPFTIADLQLSGSGSDLDVSIKEADGSVRSFLVPYSSVPNMLQPGVSNFDFIAGRSQIYGVKNQEDFLEANYIYGLNNLLTLYGGTILSDNYNAITLGNGWNTPLGAISFDATRSSSKLNNDTRHEGTSYQVAYNKYLLQTATHFSVAAWRYASQDYRTFSDHLYENDKINHQSDYDDFYDIGRKNSLSANIMQPLSNNLGNISLSALWRNYWGRSGNAKDYQFSYSNSWQRISYTFSASQSYDENDKEEERFNLFISIPFYWGDDIAKTRHQINLSNSTSFSKDGYSSNNTGITGIAGEHDQLNYGIYVNQQQQNNDTSLGTNLSWRTPIATIDGSYSHSKNTWQSGGSISSGLVVWPGGINITNQLSDTFAILDAPGLEGAHINGQKYNRTNSKGQVVYDLIIPHRENHLVLDIANSESETELQGNRQIIAPYRGAVSYVQFTTDQRKPWYIQALRPDGSPLTFGYDVLDLQENNIGVVGQGSRLFIRVDEIPTGIKVALNDEQNLFCTITFQHVIDENKTYICQ